MSAVPATAIDGFIISRQWLEAEQGITLIFWLATASGSVRLVFTGQEAVCFCNVADREAVAVVLKRLPGSHSKPTRLRNFQQQTVDALYFRSQRQLLDARDKLQQQGVVALEADIKPTDRFLMERYITGALTVKGEALQHRDFIEFQNPQIKAADFRPVLSAVSIDIETDYRAEHLYSIALYSDQEARVLMLAGQTLPAEHLDTEDGGKLSLTYYTSVADLLREFVEQLASLDPDIIMGWNVVNFDLRCLQDFADQAGVELALGRDRTTINWRQARDNRDRYYITVPGRAVLDGIELMRSATYSFENFSLEHVSRQLLNRGKLVDDVDQRGAEITELFENNKPALARYNLEDCRLVWDIFAQENLLEFAIERSQLTGLELDRYGGSVAAMDFLYLPRLHRQGYVAPAPGQNQSDNISPGGYVMDSIPGLHDNVAVLDFKSLYPSIIRTFHVDPLALVLGLEDEHAIPGFDGGRFSRQHAILPKLIETLWSARDRAKQQANREMSQAIKIIMNSFYGVLGTSACRFLDTRLVSSITKRGHQIIIDSKKQIEKHGYQVIYGDTDSLFVLIDDPQSEVTLSPHEAEQVARNLTAQLNDFWRDKLEQELGLECYLEMEFETLFTRFLMPTVRGSDAGSKKRYAGMVASGDMVFKGLESVRSDWSPLAREFQQVLYRKIFTGEEYRDYVRQLVSDLRAGKFSAELVLRKRLRRQLDEYVKNVPPHVQAARKAEAIRQERQLPALYASGGWIEYLITVNGPEPRQYRQSAIDFDFYIERQLAPIADSILVFFSDSLDNILTRQIGLF